LTQKKNSFITSALGVFEGVDADVVDELGVDVFGAKVSLHVLEGRLEKLGDVLTHHLFNFGVDVGLDERSKEETKLS
jgi:hypothetical protein